MVLLLKFQNLTFYYINHVNVKETFYDRFI